MVEQCRRVSAEKVVRQIDGLDGRESVGGVVEDFRDARVRCLTGRQATNGQVRVLLLHAFGESPGAVDDEQSAVSIGLAQNWPADAESDVAFERFVAVVGVGPEDKFFASA